MLKRLVATITVGCFLLTGSLCNAADLADRIAIIHVNHKLETYTVERWYGTRKETTDDAPLGSRQRIDLRPGERVEIKVKDPNKFLYKYTLTNGKSTETANGAAAQAFTSNLLKVLNILDPPKTSKLNQKPGSARPYGQIRLASFRQEDQALPVEGGSQMGPSATVVLEGIQELKSVVIPAPPPNNPDLLPSAEATQNYVAERKSIVDRTIQEIRALSVPTIGGGTTRKAYRDAGVPDPGQFLYDFKDDIAKLILLLSQVNSQIKQVDEGKAGVAQATVESWAVPALSQKIRASYAKIHAVNDQLSGRLGVVEEIRRSDELKDAISLRLAEAAKQGEDPDIRTIVVEALEKANKVNQGKIDALEHRIKVLTSGFTSGATEVERVNELEEAGKKLAEFTRRKLKFQTFGEQIVTLRDLIRELPRDPFSLNLELLRPYERDVEDSLKELEAFATSMTEVTKEEPMGTADYSGLVTPKILTVELAKTAPKGVTPSRQVKDYTFVFQPYSGVSLEPGAGVVFSFVEKHAFSATRSAEGKLIITDTASGDYTGTKAAFMLVIVPNKWAESDFHGLFEIGARPDSNVGLYAGAGIRLNNYFSMGAGVAFEQVDELKGNLKPGDELTSADQLKTQKRFTSGLYVHLTVSTKIGGGS